MSDPFTQAFFDHLSGDSTLTNQLGSFGGSPSVFTKRPLPPGITLVDNGPYIMTTGQVTNDPGPADVKNAAGREIIRDIRCYTDINESPSVVDAIAERVRVLFHRQSFSITGFNVIVSDVTGPIEDDDEDALGRIVSVRLVLAET